MNALLWFAIALTRSWATLYTLGLPSNVRGERREEIDCDLWEHQWLASRRGDPAAGTAIEVLCRMATGMLSDITWRAQAGSAARADRGIMNNEALYMRGLVAAGVFIALFVVLIGGGTIFNAWEDGDNEGWVIGGTLSALSGLAMAAGLLISRRRPLPGIALVAAGAICIAVLWHWMVVVTFPVGLALVGLAYARGRQRGAGPDGGHTRRSGRFGWLFLIVGASAATIVGVAAYAFSLEEWGATRAIIFNVVGFIALATGLVALTMIVSDFAGNLLRKANA